MAYTFVPDGWQDWDGNRFTGDPENVEDVQGMFVHAVNNDDPEDEHYFWAYVGEQFEDWDEWWVLIGALMDMHGMSVS